MTSAVVSRIVLHVHSTRIVDGVVKATKDMELAWRVIFSVRSLLFSSIHSHLSVRKKIDDAAIYQCSYVFKLQRFQLVFTFVFSSMKN